MTPTIAHPQALEQIEEYHEHLLEVGRSKYTMRAYVNDLTDYAEFTRKPLWPAPDDLDAQIQSWLAYRRNKGDAIVSLRRRLFAVKSYYHYAGVPHLLTSIVTPRTQWYVPKILKKHEVERVMAELAQTDTEAFNFFKLVLLSGFKFNELYTIQITQDDVERRKVLVTDEKNRTRQVVLGEVAAYLFEHFVKAGGKWNLPRHKLAKALEIAGTIAGVKKATCHMLRSTCAARMIAAGYSREFVKANMGYGSYTTIDMIIKVSKRELTDEFKQNG